jgi:hypothetical protein
MLQMFPCCFNDLQLRTETPCDIDATRKRSKSPLPTNCPSKNGLSYWRARATRGSARRRTQCGFRMARKKLRRFAFIGHEHRS